MKKASLFGLLTLGMMLMFGCSHEALRSPCPHFGAWCRQMPVNTNDPIYFTKETQENSKN